MTDNELCKSFNGFGKGNRILMHFVSSDAVMYKCKGGCVGCYKVKRLSVVIIINNVIVLEVWN